MATAKAETTSSRGQATRADILNVARLSFSEHGYHGTGIADIQEATGLTKGAFYHHFRSKESLALAILEQAAQDYAEHLVKPAMQYESPASRIEAILDRVIELNDRPDWCTCQMMATLAAELTPADDRLRQAVQAIQTDFFEMLRDLIVEARDAGEIASDLEPEAAAEWIMSTLTGLLLARKIGTTRVPPVKLIELMKQAILIKSARTGPDGDEPVARPEDKG